MEYWNCNAKSTFWSLDIGPLPQVPSCKLHRGTLDGERLLMCSLELTMSYRECLPPRWRDLTMGSTNSSSALCFKVTSKAAVMRSLAADGMVL
jgi:hypothetical protein